MSQPTHPNEASAGERHPPSQLPPFVVMGVSGAGKSTIASAIAQATGGRYVDADDLHPPQNVRKMQSGVPLTDEDRMPWLVRVGEVIRREVEGGRFVVVACSALRREYRDVLRAANPDVFFVHLTGSRELLEARVSARQGHFMPVALLDSQLATVEPLEVDEQGAVVSIAQSVPAIVATALQRDSSR